MTTRFLVCASILLTGFSATAEEAWVNDRFMIELRGWWVGLDAETSRIRNWGGGKLDLDNELDIDREFMPEVGLRWQFLPKHALQLRYNYLSFDANEFLTKGVTLDGRTIPVVSQVEADAEMHFLRLEWRRELFPEKSQSFDFETGLGVLGFDLQGEYEAYLPGFGWVGGLGPFGRSIWGELLDRTLPDALDFLNTAVYEGDEEDLTAALPLVGVGIEWRPTKRLSLKADVSGMYAGDYGEFIDAEAMLGFALTPWFELHGGYRFWHLNVEDDDDDYRLDMSGPYVGGTVRF